MRLENPPLEAGAARRTGRLPDGLTLAVALALWRLFFPGLMSADSIAQYGQALTGLYNDWHPPLMAIVLHAVFSLGGAIGLLMLGQCAAGVFGIRALAAAVLRLAGGERLQERRIAWLSLLAVVLLLLPVTPLAFYLMTFWKDAWAMILLVWIAALALDLHRLGPSPRRLLLLAGLAVALGMVRHNAVVLLPVVGLVLWDGTRRRLGAVRALILAAAPLALYMIAEPLIDRLFSVRSFHPDSQVMALDLVGLCAADRATGRPVCPGLPWTRANLRDESALAAYRPGDIGFLFWDQPAHVDPAIRADYPRLRAEYLRAVREHPGPLLRVKVAAFETLLGVDQTYYFFHGSIVDNPYRLALGGRLAPLRKRLTAVVTRVGASRLRWISGVHLVWLVACALESLALLGLWVVSRRERYRVLAGVLLIPLAYYLSYLFAAPVHDFRFMYPSTLTVQCVTLAWALGRLFARTSGGAARQPAPAEP